MTLVRRAERGWPGWRSRRAREDLWTGLLCLAPAALIVFAFTGGPVLYSLFLSLHEWSLLDPARPFVGLANYARLGRDAEFRLALSNTLLYALGVVPLGAALSLFLALLLTQELRCRAFYRLACFVPVVTSTVAGAVAWAWLFQPHYGPINHALRALGLPAPGWLSDPHWALPAVILVGIWKNLGYHVMIFLAGLQGVPRACYEAAAIDGAGGLRRFRHITWPLLAPVTAFVLVSGTIFSFLAFGTIYVLTGGGPAQSTTVLVYLLYQAAFERREMGYASALACVLFLLLALLSGFQLRCARHGGAELWPEG